MTFLSLDFSLVLFHLTEHITCTVLAPVVSQFSFPAVVMLIMLSIMTAQFANFFAQLGTKASIKNYDVSLQEMLRPWIRNCKLCFITFILREHL